MRKSNGNSWGSASAAYEDWDETTTACEKGKKRILSQAAIRAIKRKSTDGGRCTCCICHETFAADYVNLCYVGFLHQDNVCSQCRKAHNLQLVPKHR